MADGHSGTTEQPAIPADDQAALERSALDLWFALARHEWSSVVLVPAYPGGSSEGLARSLAEVGRRLSNLPVTAVSTSSLDYGTAAALADLPLFVARRLPASGGPWPTVEAPHAAGPEPAPVEAPEPQPAPASPGGDALVVSAAAHLVISIPPWCRSRSAWRPRGTRT